MDDIKKAIILKLAEEIEKLDMFESDNLDILTFNFAKNLVIAELNSKATGVTSDTFIDTFITIQTDTFDVIHDVILLICMDMLRDMAISVTSKCYDPNEIELMVSASKSVLQTIVQLKRC